MKFCPKCGTLYDEKYGECPKCTANELLNYNVDKIATDSHMTEEEQKKARKRSWIGIVIGVPAFIGFMYLLIYLFRLIRS